MAIHEFVDPKGPLAQIEEIKRKRYQAEPLKLVEVNPVVSMSVLEGKAMELSQTWVDTMANFNSDFAGGGENLMPLQRTLAECPALLALVKGSDINLRTSEQTPIQAYFVDRFGAFNAAAEDDKSKILDETRKKIREFESELKSLYTESQK